MPENMPDITLEELYNDFSKSVYWAAFNVLKDHHGAADVMQTVFLNAQRNLALINGMAPNKRGSWLYRCGVNAGIDILRRGKRITLSENADYNLKDDAKGPEALALQKEQNSLVHNAIAKLENKYKEPLYLYYFAQKDYKEICDILNINEGTLKSRMFRGREKLKKHLKEGGVNNG